MRTLDCQSKKKDRDFQPESEIGFKDLKCC